jgi:hypothetical protein
MDEQTSRRSRAGRATTSGRRRLLACLAVVAAALTVQGILPSAALADTVDGTTAPTATSTPAGVDTASGEDAGPTATSSPTTTTTGTATPSSTPTPTATPPPAPPGDGEDALSPEEVAAQIAQAKALRGALAESDAKLAALGQQLAEAAVKAAAALERARLAQLDHQAASDTLHEQLSQLSRLQAESASSAQDMARWARDAYVSGGSISSYRGWITVLQGDVVGDVSHDLAVLEHLGVLNGEELERLRTATSRQQAVASRAASAAKRAADAATAAKQANQEADALLDQQRAVLAEVQAQQLKTVGSAQAAAEELKHSKDADAIAAAAQLSAALRSQRGGVPVPIDPDQCKGLSTDGYANGEIPAAALCPVWGAPQQMLRGDAARAFTALSRQYAKAFGRPICITDSYRSRSQQVSLFGRKPNLAARPGTSNHGWGTAVDLCGGIESFGTAEHAWLLSHAPLYGWFHPSWAGPTGSRPEPWHWEYAG